MHLRNGHSCIQTEFVIDICTMLRLCQCIFVQTSHACVVYVYTPGIYAEGYIVFVFPFVCSSVRMFVCSYFRHVRGICVKVLRQSFSSGEYLSNYLSESIHIWTIVTLEVGIHSMTPDLMVHAPGWG